MFPSFLLGYPTNLRSLANISYSSSISLSSLRRIVHLCSFLLRFFISSTCTLVLLCSKFFHHLLHYTSSYLSHSSIYIKVIVRLPFPIAKFILFFSPASWYLSILQVMRAVNEAVVCTTCGDHVLFKARSQISSQYIAR